MVGFVFDLVKVGIRGKDIVVLGVVKKSIAKQQKERTVRKICALDEHVCMAFAGLTADAGIVINRARRYTQSNGYRPFGISALIVDFDYNGPPRLYQTDPSGTWKPLLDSKPVYVSFVDRQMQLVAVQRLQEFLEKNYTGEAIATDNEDIKLAIKALLEASEPFYCTLFVSRFV
ncbi:UNVERIFIED_CONTAM: hypothetical protein FKN15_062486 [Acipenser sinensis]